MKKPKKWHEAYAQGTSEGAEEQAFFCGHDGRGGLARNLDYYWVSTEHLAKEANLPPDRIEQIAVKFVKLGIVFQSPTDPGKWAYWERVPDLLKTDDASITDKDHDSRIKERNKKKRP